MLQRIQSIYLLLAGGAVFALFALAFMNVSGDTQSVAALSDGDFDINDNMILLILTILCGALALVNIFLFNNRKLQMKIGSLVMLLNLLLVAGAVYFALDTTSIEGIEKTYSAGFGMPVLAIIFTFLANRSINKDEKLVKSAYSRLR